MTTKEIKEELLKGQQFGNETVNWYTLCKPHENRFLIVINDEIKSYVNIDSVSKRISQLIKRGC